MNCMMAEEYAEIYQSASDKDITGDMIDIPEGKGLCAFVLRRRPKV